MSREIKFRAWDKTKNEMVFDGIEYEIRLLNLPSIEGHPIESQIGFSNDYDGRIFELMQFTGLHDQNGVEIYESDIVKYDYDDMYDPSGIHYPHKGKIETTIIEFESISDFPDLPNNIEIIGNIYENPELMESKQ